MEELSTDIKKVLFITLTEEFNPEYMATKEF